MRSDWGLSSGMSSFKANYWLQTALLIAAIGLLSLSAYADTPSTDRTKIFPSQIGSFRQVQGAKPLDRLSKESLLRPDYFPVNSEPQSPPTFVSAESKYSSGSDDFAVEVVRFQTDSEAYAMLTLAARIYGKSSGVGLGEPGTAHVLAERTLAFFKGTTFALVTSEKTADDKSVADFARLLATTIDEGENDLPVLVKHLPDWLNVSSHATYVTTLIALRDNVPNQPVLNAISFEGGTEAVVANYGNSQLVIIEFTTPQFSIENDSRIWTQIAESKSKGEPVPTAYRRVGNYSVLVFNAPDEKTANALIDQVKYEKVVQWLGEDPHLAERLQKYFTQTSACVLVAVLKSSGLSLLLCLAAGALIGTMMFRHRRAQKAAAYSDAGGSIRLNLDELTTPVRTQRLLKDARPAQRNSGDT